MIDNLIETKVKFQNIIENKNKEVEKKTNDIFSTIVDILKEYRINIRKILIEEYENEEFKNDLIEVVFCGGCDIEFTFEINTINHRIKLKTSFYGYNDYAFNKTQKKIKPVIMQEFVQKYKRHKTEIIEIKNKIEKIEKMQEVYVIFGNLITSYDFFIRSTNYSKEIDNSFAKYIEVYKKIFYSFLK